MLRLRDRLGRGTLFIYSVLHPKPTTSWLKLILHPFGVGTSHGRPWIHSTHHGPDSGEVTTFPHIVFSALLHRTPIQMAFIPGIPKEESRDCPGLDSPKLWEVTTPGSDLGLERGLKQTCNSSQELSNGVSHSFCTPRSRVDSRLFVVGSQTTSLTPGPSFDHNLCCKCPNGLCEAIFDIYTLSPFQ
jgi:hypothetical protein